MNRGKSNLKKSIDNFFFKKNILERNEAKFILEEIAVVYNSAGGFSKLEKWYKNKLKEAGQVDR